MFEAHVSISFPRVLSMRQMRYSPSFKTCVCKIFPPPVHVLLCSSNLLFVLPDLYRHVTASSMKSGGGGGGGGRTSI